ncbi:MAG: PAS domain S-box protein [Ferruginibacter sp.]
MNNSHTVLIIEDNIGDQILLEESLKSTKLIIERVSIAGTIAEAMLLLEQESFSIIFLDLFLPDSAGLETLHLLSKDYPGIPVIISSGLADTKIAIKAISMGAQDFLIKGEFSVPMLEKAFLYAIGRNEAEQLVKSSEEKYRHLFDNNPAVIFIWDMDDFRILNVNDTAVHLFGYTKNEFLQKTLLELRPEKEQERLINAGARLRPEDAKTSGFWKQFNKKGEVIHLDITSHKIMYQGRKVILSLANDITQKVLLEEKLEDEKIKKQQEITAAVITAQAHERTFLGEELHDNINQILATANLYLDCVLSDAVPRISLVQNSKDLVKDAMEEIRKLSKTLLPPTLGEGGLQEALNDTIESIQLVNDRIQFFTDWQVPDESLLNDKLKITIFRIVQEQLNNIFKHAKASHIIIGLKQENEVLQLRIHDDGVGFDTSQKRNGIGLQNIFGRASLLRGTASINSRPGEGCELTVNFDTRFLPATEVPILSGIEQ